MKLDTKQCYIHDLTVDYASTIYAKINYNSFLTSPELGRRKGVNTHEDSAVGR